MKRGRHKKDICKDRLYKIRITEEDMQRLKDFANKHNVTMAFVVNEALNHFYEEAAKRLPTTYAELNKIERIDNYEYKET